MGITVDVKIKGKQLRNVTDLLQGTPKKIPRVFKKALNDTVRDTRKIVITETKKITTAPVTRIRKSMTVKKAKGRATTAMQSSIVIFDERIPLINFRARQLRGSVRTLKSGENRVRLSGVSYQINKRDGRKSIRERPLRFIGTVFGARAKDPITGRRVGIKRTEAAATGNEGHRGIFKRVGGTRSQSKLVQLFGPSVGTILIDHQSTLARIRKFSGVMLEANIDKRLNDELKARA